MATSSSLDDTVKHGIQVTAKWGWTYLDTTNRWSNPQQGIKPNRLFVPTDEAKPFDDGFGVKHSKLKIRGRGKSLVIRFDSEQGKDFQLLGWSIPFIAETET